jgi:capsule polysaccharide export protein KpsE/RkpR
MDVVHKITQVPLNGDSPAKEITIKDIVIFKYTNNELTDFEIQDKEAFTQTAIDTFNTKLEEAKEELNAQREAKKMFDSNRIAESGDVVEVKFEFTDIETNEIILSNMEDEVGAQFQIDGRIPM